MQPYHIAVSQKVPARLVAGLQDQGSIRSWSPGVEPTDPTQWSSYKEGDRAANVWETTDGGTTWSNISGDLLNAPVWHVLYDETSGVLYVGESLGVFERLGHGGHWVRLSEGLPNAPILDLALSADHRTLFAADYGRGVYQTRLPHNVAGGGGG